MDDSIYRDFYWAADRIGLWWAIAWPYLKSDAAIHAYVVLGVVATLGTSSVIAYKAKRRLHDLKQEVSGIKFAGRPPKRQASIEKRISDMRKKTLKTWLPFVGDFLLLIAFGLCVPSLGLLLLGAHYSWFDASGVAFIDLDERTPIHIADTLTLIVFVFNQIVHSAFLDLPEIFDLNVGRIDSNPSNIWFSTITFMFRTVATVFTAALGLAIQDTLVVFWKLRTTNRKKTLDSQTQEPR